MIEYGESENLLPRNPKWQPPKRNWFSKFADAGRGIAVGILGQSSFAVHLFMALAVIILSATLGCSRNEWCLLIGCITVVLTCELFNSALEAMARGLCDRYQEDIRDSLDIASGAVLVAATGAAIVGIVILLPKLWLTVFG